jgi:sulfate adenylyltransferase large subunit
MTSDRALLETDIEGYLHRYQDKDLLRFVAVGSVDDGKSTLIGRLLFDTGSVYEDQLAAIRKATHMAGAEIDLSLLTDGLAAEREQGITIDVAYRYFTTDKRKFIIADTPGHVQYTRNMVTGASTADVAVILIDARLGVLQQSRRHAYIASLLGIRQLAVCVNKMDLVGYDPGVFARIRSEFTAFTDQLPFAGVTFFPISALEGANCVRRSPKTGWFDGPTVLEFLETVPVHDERRDPRATHFRFPVQYVLRPHLDYRGFAGRVTSGIVERDDAILVLPSGKRTSVKAIDAAGHELSEAFAPQSVVIRLEDEVDVSRGDMLVHPGFAPRATRTFDAHLVWMHEVPLDALKTYLLKHTTQVVRAEIDRVHWRKDMDTLEEIGAPTLGLNDIGRVTLTAHRTLFVDAYPVNRETGSFILIDALSNNTVAAGMVIETDVAREGDPVISNQDAAAPSGSLSRVRARERRARFGTSAGIVVVLGPAAVQAEALSYTLERRLFDFGASGVVVRARDASGVAAVARAIADAGLLAIVAVQARVGDSVPADLRNDERLLVVRVTDRSDPASVPPTLPAGAAPELTVDTSAVSQERGADAVLVALRGRGWIG